MPFFRHTPLSPFHSFSSSLSSQAHSIDQHPDNKAYKIQTPQAPLVQTRRHAEFQMDDYPQGTNAVVAVISYTVRARERDNENNTAKHITRLL